MYLKQVRTEINAIYKWDKSTSRYWNISNLLANSTDIKREDQIAIECILKSTMNVTRMICTRDTTNKWLNQQVYKVFNKHVQRWTNSSQRECLKHRIRAYTQLSTTSMLTSTRKTKKQPRYNKQLDKVLNKHR